MAFLVFIGVYGFSQTGKSFNAGVENKSPVVNAEYLIRAYHDNDFINFRGMGTDDAYTGGIRADIFFTKKKDSRFFIDRILPKAGARSNNIFQWGIMQVVYTPQDLDTSAYLSNDYAYAGGLYLIHSLYSYNALKKYSFQTEVNLGVMGPASLAEESQELIHRAIGYERPRGWQNQIKTDLLFNLNFTAEKQILGLGRFMEFIGGSKLSVGTQMNSVALYPLIRIGWMNPYFEGFISQYSNTGHSVSHPNRKFQFYGFVRPSISWVLTNAMLEGGFFSDHMKREEGELIKYQNYQTIEHIIYQADFGTVMSYGQFSISVSQNISSMLIRNTYGHEYGNVSLYFAW
jgi:lipid A 3-O-deacylase